METTSLFHGDDHGVMEHPYGDGMEDEMFPLNGEYYAPCEAPLFQQLAPMNEEYVVEARYDPLFVPHENSPRESEGDFHLSPDSSIGECQMQKQVETPCSKKKSVKTCSGKKTKGRKKATPKRTAPKMSVQESTKKRKERLARNAKAAREKRARKKMEMERKEMLLEEQANLIKALYDENAKLKAELRQTVHLFRLPSHHNSSMGSLVLMGVLLVLMPLSLKWNSPSPFLPTVAPVGRGLMEAILPEVKVEEFDVSMPSWVVCKDYVGLLTDGGITKPVTIVNATLFSSDDEEEDVYHVTDVVHRDMSFVLLHSSLSEDVLVRLNCYVESVEILSTDSLECSFEEQSVMSATV